MAWTTGTATNFKDLLEQVKDYAELQGWTVNAYDTGGAAPRTDSVYLTGPGYGVGYECYVGIRTYEDSANNHYCFELRGATGYDGAQTWDTQPGRSPNIVIMRLWNGSINFWLSVTDRRILLIAKCSNTYHSLYAGFFNPFANPTEYPYPMYIASDAGSYGPFGNTDTDVRCVAFPGRAGAYYRDPAGNWRMVCVHSSQGDYGFQEARENVYTIWPYLSLTRNADNPSGNYGYPPYTRVEPLPGVSDSLFMLNCYLMGMDDEEGVLGVLEGLYWVPGNTLSAEQQLTVGSDDYRLFIAISRSIESPSQFYAVKEA
jgi:hypothetical protein